MVNRMIAATIGFLIAVSSFAPNEACARSAGAGGVIGRGAVGLGASRSINRSIGPGLGWSRFSAHPFRPRNFALRRDLRLRRFWLLIGTGARSPRSPMPCSMPRIIG
jgi:hypothetical protein